MVQVHDMWLLCSYLYEAISCFEARIFNKFCQLQGQLMPQPVNKNSLLIVSSSSKLNEITTATIIIIISSSSNSSSGSILPENQLTSIWSSWISVILRFITYCIYGWWVTNNDLDER